MLNDATWTLIAKSVAKKAQSLVDFVFRMSWTEGPFHVDWTVQRQSENFSRPVLETFASLRKPQSPNARLNRKVNSSPQPPRGKTEFGANGWRLLLFEPLFISKGPIHPPFWIHTLNPHLRCATRTRECSFHPYVFPSAEMVAADTSKRMHV